MEVGRGDTNIECSPRNNRTLELVGISEINSCNPSFLQKDSLRFKEENWPDQQVLITKAGLGALARDAPVGWSVTSQWLKAGALDLDGPESKVWLNFEIQQVFKASFCLRFIICRMGIIVITSQC